MRSVAASKGYYTTGTVKCQVEGVIFLGVFLFVVVIEPWRRGAGTAARVRLSRCLRCHADFMKKAKAAPRSAPLSQGLSLGMVIPYSVIRTVLFGDTVLTATGRLPERSPTKETCRFPLPFFLVVKVPTFFQAPG